MRGTTNKFQRAYMIAKSHVQEIESQQEEIEKKYIADNGIVNADGSIPEFVWCIYRLSLPQLTDATKRFSTVFPPFLHNFCKKINARMVETISCI